MFSTLARRLTAAGLALVATTALTLAGPSALAGNSTEWGVQGSKSAVQDSAGRSTNGGSTEWGLNGGSTEWGLLKAAGSTEWG